MPSPNPRALKAGDLGRHVRTRRLHVERIRQRNDGLWIDGERLGASTAHDHHEDHGKDRANSTHIPPGPPKPGASSTLAAKQAFWTSDSRSLSRMLRSPLQTVRSRST